MTFPCDKCERVFRGEIKLKEHEKRKHEGLKYPCDQCDRVYSEKKPSTHM